MGIEFFQTVMGKRFFEGDVPRLVRVLEALVDALDRRPVETRVATAEFGEVAHPPPGEGWRARQMAHVGTTTVVILWERR